MMKKIMIVALCMSFVATAALQTLNAAAEMAQFDEIINDGAQSDEIQNTEESAADEEADSDELLDAEKDSVILPQLFIKAVNPGYKINGVNNVGEMIEISRIKSSDAPILLAGITVGYTNSSGNPTVLYEFPEDSWMSGESILLRLASSPGHELASVNYTKTLAMSGGISLYEDGEIIDEVCWTGKDGCHKAFTSAKPTTLVRNMETGEFEHKLVYVPNYEAEAYFVEEKVEEGGTVVAPQCKGLRFSEILSYYESEKSEQFIELYNAGVERVMLDGCKVRYKNKNYLLTGAVEVEGYYVYYPNGFSLTKNPTNVGRLELVDTDGAVVDILEYPNGQRKGTAYAMIGYDASGAEIWKTTYAPTPGAPNNYQEFKTCEAGKVINPATGNCVKVAVVAEKVCKEGYYLNILTGRCKKIVTATEKTCKEGYYLNPVTNRCKKIQENKGADYGLEPESHEENSAFVALHVVLGVLGLGVVYLVYEFRHEIVKLWRKVCRRAP